MDPDRLLMPFAKQSARQSEAEVGPRSTRPFRRAMTSCATSSRVAAAFLMFMMFLAAYPGIDIVLGRGVDHQNREFKL